MVRRQWLLAAIPLLTAGCFLSSASVGRAAGPFERGGYGYGYGYGPRYASYGYVGSPYNRPWFSEWPSYSYGYYGSPYYNYSYGYSPGPSYSYGYSSVPYYSSGVVEFSPTTPYAPLNTAQRNSYYNLSANEPPLRASDSNAARIRIEVPANAEVWFDNTKTQQTGTERSFESPPLDPQRNYAYDITARWMNDGREIKRTKTVAVHAGDRLSLTFGNRTDESTPAENVVAPTSVPTRPAIDRADSPPVPAGENPQPKTPERR